MPKRIGNLMERIDLDALHEGYLKARAGKRALPSTLAFERDLGANLVRLHAEIHEGRYRIEPYRRFLVYEPKVREISAPAFRDRVVQHALYALMYPIFDATFVHDSYGCRVGKGTHAAADQAQRFMRAVDPTSYSLQIDIRKFYYRIDRGLLRGLVERKIKDKVFVDLALSFAEQAEPLGLPIGNLLSQLFALIYLNPFDHWMKREQKVRRYVRYVDDVVVFGLNRAQAVQLLAKIREYLGDTLRLELSKYRIAPVRKGVNFVGFRTWRRIRFVRKCSLFRFSRSLRRGDVPSLNAIMGHARRTATLAHFRRRVAAERPDLMDVLAHMHATPRLPQRTSLPCNSLVTLLASPLARMVQPFIIALTRITHSIP